MVQNEFCTQEKIATQLRFRVPYKGFNSIQFNLIGKAGCFALHKPFTPKLFFRTLDLASASR